MNENPPNTAAFWVRVETGLGTADWSVEYNTFEDPAEFDAFTANLDSQGIEYLTGGN